MRSKTTTVTVADASDADFEIHKGPKLWEEDDAGTRDREGVSDAWERLFEEPMPGEDEAVVGIDYGDCVGYLFEDGRYWEFGPACHRIYVLCRMEWL